MNKMPRLVACFAVLLCCTPAWTQDQAEETAATEVRRYTVEVIVFRYAEDVGAGSEMFVPDEPEPLPPEDMLELADTELRGDTGLKSDGAAVEMPEEIPDEMSEEELEAMPDPEFVLLEEDDFQLAEAWGRLERLDAYDPLMHFGWTQIALAQDQAEAIPLYRFGRPPEDLDGTLMLHLGRYLHLTVALELRKPEPGQPASGVNGFSTIPEEPLPPTFYSIQESRIMKNGDLRYFDHPKFGVLARVSRVEEETPPEDGELLGYPLQ